MKKYYVQENTVVVIDRNGMAYMIHVRGANGMPMVEKIYENYDESVIEKDYMKIDSTIGVPLVSGIKRMIQDRIDSLQEVIETAEEYQEDLEMI